MVKKNSICPFANNLAPWQLLTETIYTMKGLSWLPLPQNIHNTSSHRKWPRTRKCTLIEARRESGDAEAVSVINFWNSETAVQQLSIYRGNRPATQKYSGALTGNVGVSHGQRSLIDGPVPRSYSTASSPSCPLSLPLAHPHHIQNLCPFLILLWKLTNVRPRKILPSIRSFLGFNPVNPPRLSLPSFKSKYQHPANPRIATMDSRSGLPQP